MNSFTPIYTIIVGVLFFQTKITSQQIIGTLIGFSGISWLIMLSSPVNGNFQLAPAMAILLATLLYGFSLNTIKHKLAKYKPIQIATGGFSMAFLPAAFCFFYFDTPRVFDQNNHAVESFTYILILGLIGTAFAVILFNRIIAQTTALAASTVTYFIPIIPHSRTIFYLLVDNSRSFGDHIIFQEECHKWCVTYKNRKLKRYVVDMFRNSNCIEYLLVLAD
jgi:drug/metabolite transporter (DMT)-like permease